MIIIFAARYVHLFAARYVIFGLAANPPALPSPRALRGKAKFSLMPKASLN
jgi:hypothetical protein